VSSLLDFLLGLCFSIYLLMQKENLISGVKRLVKAYLSPRNSERLIRIGTAMNEIYSSFISGQCLDALILGAMVTVALLIFRINYALLIGIVIAVTALVPVVGAFLGGAVGVFLLLMISLREAIVFLVIFLVLQQIDNRLVYPYVVGNAVGLPAVWIFAAIVVGGNFGGIFGMILAIPLFALVYTLVSEDLHKREVLQEKR
jgi:predicted PurR-regulated permease PerM